MYYLGIDSGATKASFLLTDETGRVFARSLQPGCAVLGARKEGVKRMVESGLREILQKNGRILKKPVYDPDVGAVLMAIRHDRPEYDIREFSLREE